MSRPRIRTLKPEMWEDEKVGHVSRDARLLFVGLITMADDEGKFRALPAVVLGHVFPYDADAARKLGQWLNELLEVGLVELWETAGVRYGMIVNFRKHQRISHPRASLIPSPNGSRASA